MRQRTRLVVNVGNSLELLGAGCAVCGVYCLAGAGWALVAGAAFLIAAAELVFDSAVWRIPLPLRPQLKLRWAEHRSRWRVRRARRVHARREAARRREAISAGGLRPWHASPSPLAPPHVPSDAGTSAKPRA